MRVGKAGPKPILALCLMIIGVAVLSPPCVAQSTNARVQQLFSSDPTVRGAAKEELMQHPDPAAVPELLKVLPGSQGTIRDNLLEILGRYDDPRKIPVYLSLIKPFHWDNEKQAIRDQLARLDGAAADAVLAACKGESEEYSIWASGIFQMMHENGLPYFLKAVQDDDACVHGIGERGLRGAFGDDEPDSAGVANSDIELAANAAIDPDQQIRAAARKWFAQWTGNEKSIDFSGMVDALIGVYQSSAPPETMVKIARMLSEPQRPRVTRFMRAAVRAPNPEIQEIAKNYLEQYGVTAESVVPPKRAISQRGTPEEKIAYLQNLGSPRKENDNANAIRYLSDPDERVRAAAASTLGDLDAVSMNGRDEPGPGSDQAPAALMKSLQDKSAVVRAASASALSAMRTTEAIDDLVATLRDSDPRVALAAAKAIEFMPNDSAVPELTTIYHDAKSSAELKEQAIATLAVICSPDSLSVFLHELDSNEAVNPPANIGYALRCILYKKADASAYEPIRQKIEAQRPRPQEALIIALGETKNPAALSLLTELVQGRNIVVQKAAADALGELGDTRAVIPLTAMLRDGDASQRIRAAATLAKLSDFVAPQELLATLHDPDSTLRLWGTKALARSRDPKAIHELIAAISSEPQAITALGESKSPEAVTALIAFLGNPANKTSDRAAAATSLGKLGDPRAVEPLIASLKEGNGQITMQAATALAELKDQRAVQPLKEAYQRWQSGQRENGTTVSTFLLRALQGLGSTGLMIRVTGSLTP
jgi:HEAT repeat protein